MSEVKTNKITAATGTAITLGDSGDTFTVPSGATLDIASGATLDINGTVDFAGATVSNLSAGKILQVVAANKTDKTTVNSGSFAAVPGLSITITPSSTSNKIALWAAINGSEYGYIRWHRDGSQIGSNLGSNVSASASAPVMYLDSPSSTSALTYQIYARHYSSSYTFKINNGISTSDTAFSTVMAMEVEG
ncbi:MAG: hypothetical protein QF535_04295 [Anaerolineales bacterium]|nr:hypothetical protein [Anaerolineales bacterium]